MVNINHGIALSTVIVADNQSSREAKAAAITNKATIPQTIIFLQLIYILPLSSENFLLKFF